MFIFRKYLLFLNPIFKGNLVKHFNNWLPESRFELTNWNKVMNMCYHQANNQFGSISN